MLILCEIVSNFSQVGQLMIERSKGGGINCINPDGFAEEIGELIKMVHVSGFFAKLLLSLLSFFSI